MKRHFAFVTIPADGHVNPTLALVEELVRRGHRVSYATGAAAARRVEAAGARPVVLPTYQPSISPEDVATPLPLLLSQTDATLPLLLEHFGRDRPDALCYGRLALAGRMAAAWLGVADVALLASFASNERFSLCQGQQEGVLAEFGEKVRVLADRYGVSQPIRPQEPASLNLVFIPRWFQVHGDSFDERFRFLGPSVGRRARLQWRPADPGRPLLFISLGTVFHRQAGFYRLCLEAFRDSRWQVAMSVGSEVDRGDLGPVPPNFEVRESFPQPAVLEHATVFVSHAGMNSAMEALYYGVPLVALPQTAEQEVNAARLEELGVGRRLAGGPLTPSLVRSAVDMSALDETLRDNVARRRLDLLRCAGPSGGADALEKHLLSRRAREKEMRPVTGGCDHGSSCA